MRKVNPWALLIAATLVVFAIVENVGHRAMDGTHAVGRVKGVSLDNDAEGGACNTAVVQLEVDGQRVTFAEECVGFFLAFNEQVDVVYDPASAEASARIDRHPEDRRWPITAMFLLAAIGAVIVGWISAKYRLDPTGSPLPVARTVSRSDRPD